MLVYTGNVVENSEKSRKHLNYFANIRSEHGHGCDSPHGGLPINEQIQIGLLVQDLPYRPVKILRARDFLVLFVIYSPWTSKLQEVIFKNRWHNAARA